MTVSGIARARMQAPSVRAAVDAARIDTDFSMVAGLDAPALAALLDARRAAGAPASEGAPDGAGLPGGSPAAAYEAFLSGYAQAWMPAFAERLAAEARHPFYRAAAAYLGALVG